MVLRGPFRLLGFEPGLFVCQVNAYSLFPIFLTLGSGVLSQDSGMDLELLLDSLEEEKDFGRTHPQVQGLLLAPHSEIWQVQ